MQKLRKTRRSFGHTFDADDNQLDADLIAEFERDYEPRGWPWKQFILERIHGPVNKTAPVQNDVSKVEMQKDDEDIIIDGSDIADDDWDE